MVGGGPQNRGPPLELPIGVPHIQGFPTKTSMGTPETWAAPNIGTLLGNPKPREPPKDPLEVCSNSAPSPAEHRLAPPQIPGPPQTCSPPPNPRTP